MEISFYKYHGAGNDFIIIDKTENPNLELSDSQIRFLCDRRMGIGADGLMFYYPLEDFNFGMSYFNADGYESTMCGNGGRCMTAFWKSRGNKELQAKFKSIDGEHLACFEDGGIIRLGMNDVTDIRKTLSGYIMDTGSPHLVIFRSNIEEINVQEEGRLIRYSKEFAPDGINVNFVELKENKIFIRTYERGVETETLSCGTGSVAACIAASLKTGSGDSVYDIVAPGGNMKVRFVKTSDNSYKEIFLEGPAVFVYKGIIKI